MLISTQQLHLHVHSLSDLGRSFSEAEVTGGSAGECTLRFLDGTVQHVLKSVFLNISTWAKWFKAKSIMSVIFFFNLSCLKRNGWFIYEANPPQKPSPGTWRISKCLGTASTDLRRANHAWQADWALWWPSDEWLCGWEKQIMFTLTLTRLSTQSLILSF